MRSYFVQVSVCGLVLLGTSSTVAQTEEQSLKWAIDWGASHYPSPDGTRHELIFRVDRLGKRNPLSDKDVLKLSGLTNSLEKLSLYGNHELTVEGYRQLGKMKHLWGLFLSQNSNVGDAELGAISKSLPKLTQLDLSETSVTDTAVEHLASLKDLEKVNLKKTKISDEAVRRLQKANPDLKVYR